MRQGSKYSFRVHVFRVPSPSLLLRSRNSPFRVRLPCRVLLVSPLRGLSPFRGC